MLTLTVGTAALLAAAWCAAWFTFAEPRPTCTVVHHARRRWSR